MYDKSHTLALLEYAPSGIDDTAASVRLPGSMDPVHFIFSLRSYSKFPQLFCTSTKEQRFRSIFDRHHSDSCLAVSVSHSEYTGTASLLCLYVFPITPVFGAMGCVIERHKATTVLSQQRRYDFFYFCMIRFPHHVQSSTRIPRCQSLYILI